MIGFVLSPMWSLICIPELVNSTFGDVNGALGSLLQRGLLQHVNGVLFFKSAVLFFHRACPAIAKGKRSVVLRLLNKAVSAVHWQACQLLLDWFVFPFMLRWKIIHLLPCFGQKCVITLVTILKLWLMK